MNKFHSTFFAALVASLLVMTSCNPTDEEAPTVCTGLGAEFSVTADEIDAEAGDHVDIQDTFCDNEGLSEVRWDVHNAADHSHEEGEEEEGLILHSGTDWEVIETMSISGEEATSTFHADVPLTARGVWDLVVSVVDAEGNVGPDVVTQIHIENSHIPEFTLTTVNGEDPNGWEEEPVWAPGTEVTVAGSIGDSDGVQTASLEFIRESDEAVVWASDLTPAGATNHEFSVTVTVPADAETGEYHFEMLAADANGVDMETGFHVEVE